MHEVVITGANRGIGLEIARRLAARGDRVTALVRKGSPELEAIGAHVVEGVDAAEAKSLEGLASKVPAPQIDWLVLNAGIFLDDTFGKLDAAGLEKQLAVNAVGPVLVAQALAPKLARGGKVAIVTSRMGSIADNGSSGYYGYRMSKAALNMAGKSLSIDLAPRGVAVALLHPGYVRTGMTGGQGAVDAADSARQLVERIDALTTASTGSFVHAAGERLPW